ncbi:outer membrane protein assembly factor BamA [Pelagibacterales bacterium SAG-MED17]|nr:outer membrane protein assembly factor BamA [Pelagibacterales bacterium SAG-MED17]
MKNFLKKTINKFGLILIIYIFAFTSIIKAEIYNEIKVTGNKRLSVETVLMFSGLNTDRNLNNNDLNSAIKKLYETDYFKDIEILILKDKLEIKIIENPIIQTISINGIKNKSIIRQLEDITKKSEKYPFLISNVNDQKNLLSNIVRSSGFYFSSVNTRIIENKNNSVDLIYDFNLGERAVIKNINFQGNKIFKGSKLRDIIKSEEGKFWKFITSNKYLDERKIKIDEKLLNEFYKNKGYYNVNVKSSYAKNINNKYFELNFNIDAGEKFYFSNINLNLRDEFENENFKNVTKIIKKLEGKKYSKKILDDILDEINKITIQKEFVFVDVNYDEKIVEGNRINIDLNFNDLEKIFVEQINIFGNFITEEKVIRNSLIVDEGDPFNVFLFDKSISNIKSRGIFRNVKSDIKQSTNDPQKKVINIIVEESPTGEIFAGAGAGTSGATVSAGIKEKNYLGKGIRLASNLTLSESQIKGKFSIINPNFKNSDRSFNTTFESTSTDTLTTSGFKTSRTGFSIGTGFEQYKDLFVNFDLSAYYEKLETSSSASNYKKKQEGDYLENLIKYRLVLNKLDQNFQPTEGFKMGFEQVLPIYSDDLSIENTLNYSKYISISDNLIVSTKFFAKAVNSIDDDVRVSRRVYIPSSKLRGFEPGQFGPKDGNEYVGGNYGTALNINSTLPNIFSGNDDIDLSLFLDAATLREVDYDSSLESSEIRSSTGLSVNWFTVLGPLSFSYAIPLTSEPSDTTESFRFRIGTSF